MIYLVVLTNTNSDILGSTYRNTDYDRDIIKGRTETLLKGDLLNDKVFNQCVILETLEIREIQGLYVILTMTSGCESAWSKTKKQERKLEGTQ